MRLIARTFAVALAAVMLASSAAPAYASLTRVAGPTAIYSDSRLIDRFDVAFDAVNQVYLVVWGTFHNGPTNGMFLNASGAPIGSIFAISSGSEQAGWARVTAGGGKFLVAYTKILAPGHSRHARFVTYQNGSPSLGSEIPIDAWPGGAGDASGVAFSNGRYFVTWWNDSEPMPQSYLAVLDSAGTKIATKVTVSTAGDGQTDPEIACDPARNQCLVVGQSWGVFNPGVQPGTWGQFVSDVDGSTIGAGFTVGYGPNHKEATVAYSAASNRFIVAFSRFLNVVYATRINSATRSIIDEYEVMSAAQRPDGAGYGLPRIVYNPTTQSSMIAMMPWIAMTGTIELDASGTALPATLTFIEGPGGNNGTKFVAAASDTVNARFLAADVQAFLHLRSTVFSGGTPCTVSLSGTSASFSGAASSGSINLAASTTACAWTASSNASWLTVTSAASGAGSGTVTYSVAPNSGATRSGTLTVAGQTFTVTQSGCSFALESAGVSIGAGGATNAGLGITAGASCGWTAVSAAQWIATSSTGTGNGTALWSAARNPLPFARTGQISVGGLYFTVTQAAATADDINDDGRPDILFQNDATGEVVSWYQNIHTVSGTGAIATEPDLDWKIVASGDLNADGQTDVIWRNTATGAMRVWLLNGPSVSETVAITPAVVDANWKVVASADFNLDGVDDLIWEHDGNGDRAVWMLRRDGAAFTYGETRFLTPQRVGTNWKIRGAGDFNRDGYPDLVWQDASAGWIAVWFMTRTASGEITYTDTRLFSIPQVGDTNWKIVGVGEFNGDLRADILWQHQVSGHVALWLTWDNIVLDTRFLSTSQVDPVWRIVSPK